MPRSGMQGPFDGTPGYAYISKPEPILVWDDKTNCYIINTGVLVIKEKKDPLITTLNDDTKGPKIFVFKIKGKTD